MRPRMRAATRWNMQKAALGIEEITWQRNEGQRALWHVRRHNGQIVEIWTHHACTETGVLQEAAKVIPLKNSPAAVNYPPDMTDKRNRL